MKSKMTNKYFAQLVGMRMKYTDSGTVAEVVQDKIRRYNFFAKQYGLRRQA